MPQDGVSVDLLGFDELERGSVGIFRRVEDSAPREFERAAEQVASEVRSRVPVLTGLLMSSVTASHTHEGATVRMGGEGVPYAGWIEFGGTRGRPYVRTGRYLYPVATSAQPLLVATGERAATREIGRARWQKPS